MFVEGGKEVVLFVRLHQSHDSVIVFQRSLLSFGRGDINPKILGQDRSFSFPVGEMTAREPAQPDSLRAPFTWGMLHTPTHGAAAAHHSSCSATLGRNTK